MTKLKPITLTIVSIVFTLATSFAASAMSKPTHVPTVMKTEGWLVPRDIAESGDFKIVWQFNLPLNEREQPDKLFVSGNRLCVLSNRNFLTCIDRADGNVVFSENIAMPGLPLMGINCYKDEIFTLVGNKLIETGVESGIQKTSTAVASGATCPVVRNNDYFYIAGINRRLHALKTSNKVQAFEVAAENDSLITSVLADDNSVFFATDKGNVICIRADKAAKVWQFDAPGAVVVSIVRDGESLYFACRDTNIYKLNLLTGELAWKYQTQAILDSSPQTGDKVIYQHIPDVGLIAVNKGDGKQLWQVDKGIGLLAESGNKAFIATATGTIVVMDNAKAKQLYTINVGKPVKFAVNTIDSKIYIADKEGRLACLEPVR